MDSDVKLEPGQVKVEAWDLCLDSPDRRKPEGKSEFRRALVHDPDDGLTLNWGYDYPGDVTITGRQVKVEAWDLCLDSPDRRKPEGKSQFRRALVHDFDDGLTLNYGHDYPGGVTIEGGARVDGSLVADGGFAARGSASVHSLDVHGELEIAPPSGPELQELKSDLVARYLGKTPPGKPRQLEALKEKPPRVDVLGALIRLVHDLDALTHEIDFLKKQLAAAQENWRWCSQCRCLFFAGNPENTGECPASKDKVHTLVGSGNYRLLHT